MDFIKQWALTLVSTAAISTFVVFLAPSGNAEKTLKAITGIFVVASVCMPLSNVAFEHRDVFLFSEQSVDMQYNEEIEQCYEDFLKESIAQQISAAAKEYGVMLNGIEAEISTDENNCIIIHNITVDAEETDSSAVAEFEGYIKDFFEIPVEVSFAAEG